MKFENTQVFNFEGALRGMRNPKESWSRSDSIFYCNAPGGVCCKDCANQNNLPCNHNALYIGENDMKLAQSLIRAGSEHRKFMRQIFVSVDITASLYWWKEFDTYKVGTVANSTSTMHKIHSKPITLDCFETDDYDSSLPIIDPINIGIRVESFIEDLEQLRQMYLYYNEKSKDPELTEPERKESAVVAKKYWKELIRWLPESWLQTRTVTMNYENLLAMFRQRNTHKLSEWREAFCDWVKTLPYTEELIMIE